ncbi:MAG TPA: Gfo/Idh/MocA family oxidoreductase, partial [Saprospiraceae bacterium]|nr:Gfo/Idh/MocA family oxidoreductase [Saprospiraceae bacterium]
MPTPIRWGIIGLGKIAHKFAADLRQVPDARLVAVASTSPERAAAFAAEHGAAHVFSRYEDLARCAEVDVVYIATPHHQHCPCTLMCLEEGRAVLCEKPFALCAADARRMVETARRKGLFLMEALWTCFIPAT